MKAVILAGGKGTRLRPYTNVFPKPLMPIGDKPILEIIIRQLKAQGVTDIILTIGYLGELVMSFFGDGSRFGVNITYSKEERPLGTAGGLGLIKQALDEPFLMVNGDTLTTLNFAELIAYHHKHKSVATIALNKRESYIDFGIVELDSEGVIRGYTEKPTIKHLVSMGAYVFDPAVLKYIKPNESLDFPDLIKALIKKGETVRGFVFEGYWLDIGRTDDYEKANEEISKLDDILNL